MTGPDHRAAKPNGCATQKIVWDHAELACLIAAAKHAGKRVVLTNGVFDLVHVGHVRCLEDARRRGDLLVVAVNDDASVRRYKGAGRPFVPAPERAEVVAAFECVDLVTVFSEPTVDGLLRLLKPAVHAKGTDDVGGVPEPAAARAVGAETAIVGDPNSHSTTALIDAVGRFWAGRQQGLFYGAQDRPFDGAQDRLQGGPSGIDGAAATARGTSLPASVSPHVDSEEGENRR